MDCAQGQRVGMVFCSAARLAGSDSENDAKPGGGNWLKVAWNRSNWTTLTLFSAKRPWLAHVSEIFSWVKVMDFPNFIGRAILRQGLLAEKVCFSPSSGAFFTGSALEVLSVELISPNKEKYWFRPKQF